MGNLPRVSDQSSMDETSVTSTGSPDPNESRNAEIENVQEYINQEVTRPIWNHNTKDLGSYDSRSSHATPDKKRRLSEGSAEVFNVGIKMHRVTQEEPRQKLTLSVRCRLCLKDCQKHFPRHLVTHFYDLWSKEEVSRVTGKRECPRKECGKVQNNWREQVQHLASVHGELAEKLEAQNVSLSDYEVDVVKEELKTEQYIIE